MKLAFLSWIFIFSALSTTHAYDKVRNGGWDTEICTSTNFDNPCKTFGEEDDSGASEYPFAALASPALKLQRDLFAEQAKTLSSLLGLNFGENESTYHEGSSAGNAFCQVYINNKTAIDPTFPDSTKKTQRIEILIQTNSRSSKFFLSRTSQVRIFDFQARTGATSLYIRANNKTGGRPPSSRMIQEARITRTSNANQSLSIEVTDFDGKPLSCIFENK